MGVRQIDLSSSPAFRGSAKLSAAVLALLGLASILAAGKVGRAHGELFLAGIVATTMVWSAATVVYRLGRKDAVIVTVDDEGLEISGVMLREPLRLATEDIMVTTFDESKVRTTVWPAVRRFRVEQRGWLFGVGRKRAPLPILNVESYTPNVAVVLTRPVELPAQRPLFSFFLKRYPYHRGSREPLRGFALAVKDLAQARAALQPLGVSRDPMQVDLEILLSGRAALPSAV